MRNTRGEGITVTVMYGDGIGEEVVSSAIRVIEATGMAIEWDYQLIGDAARGTGKVKKPALPQATLRSIERSGVALKGPTATPLGAVGHRSLNVKLRVLFDLFANVRPIHTVEGITTRFSGVPIDILLFRENTEGEYAIVERKERGNHSVIKGTWTFSRSGCARIARHAFKQARLLGRKKVTAVTKANIFQLGHGLFLQEARKIAKQFPDIEYQELLADNCLMQIVTRPERFDVILTTNLLGDLLSDLCAGLIGGLGFAPGANIGQHYAIFEAVHGTAPDIVGMGIANPASMILSGAMMLDHLHFNEQAERIRHALYQVVEHDGLVTPDGRVKSSKEFTDAIVARLR